MPDASGRFRGISVPRIPWHDEPDSLVEESIDFALGSALRKLPDESEEEFEE